jgi:hypothetical protein
VFRESLNASAQKISTDGSTEIPCPNCSALNEVVGFDGVLVISLESQLERFVSTASNLASAGIYATKFPATDVANSTDEQLDKGCLLPSSPNYTQRCGPPTGCGKKVEQAIADSHRQALLAASNRIENWTAILEDDMALLHPESWDQAFRKAWQQVPPEAKIVRLSWCMIVPPHQDVAHTYADAGEFVLSKFIGLNEDTYHPGVCTGGYLVHRDILPEMLSLFPCCNVVDWCYYAFFRSLQKSGEYRGMDVMVSMEGRRSRLDIENITKDVFLAQHGVMFQARNFHPSTRE